MGEGKGLRLYMLIGAIMFGLLAGAIAIFGDEEGSFEGGLVEDDSNCVVATDEDFSGTDNGYFSYIGSDECVKIPHVIKGVEVTSYRGMFSETSVSKVVSDNLNITDMLGMFSFSKATELDLSSFDTSNVTNMKSMFADSQATELDLSNFNTSNVTNMNRMFAGSEATELDLSSFNTSNVTGMAYMFSSSEVTELDLSNFNTSNVTNMRSMFWGSLATELDLSSIDTSKVTDMAYMFDGSLATELDLSSFDTSNVTNMRSMFYRSQDTELDLSSFNTSNVTDMTGMFSGSKAKTVYARTQEDADKLNASNNKPNGLKAVVKGIEPNEGGGIVEGEPNCVLATDEDFGVKYNGVFRYIGYIGSDDCVKIPHVIKGVEVTSYNNMFNGTSVSKVVSDNPNVTDMSYMFWGSQATEIDLSSFDTSKVTDMGAMFYGSQATELDLSNFDTSNVTDMLLMFMSSEANTVYARTQADADKYNESIGKPDGLQVIVKDREPNEGVGTLEEEDDPNCVLATDEDFSGTTNGSFRYRGSAGCVKIPHVIKGEDVTSYRSMFDVSSVNKVVSDNPNVTNMDSMFAYSQAAELDLSNFDTSNVTNMSDMFKGSEVTELDVSSFDTSNVTNMDSMFSYSHATELDLSSFNTSNVANMENMFDGSHATELDLSSFNTSKVTNMEWMFSDSQATEIDLSSFDTSKVTNMSMMFYNSQAKTVYARTQADADNFNASSSKPNGLKVIVKQ